MIAKISLVNVSETLVKKLRVYVHVLPAKNLKMNVNVSEGSLLPMILNVYV